MVSQFLFSRRDYVELMLILFLGNKEERELREWERVSLFNACVSDFRGFGKRCLEGEEVWFEVYPPLPHADILPQVLCLENYRLPLREQKDFL